MKAFTINTFLYFFSFIDVPGPVGIPFLTENLTNDSCKLTWFSPEDDGGSAITNYVIEKREADHRAWTPVTYTVTRQNATVQGLIEGKAYFFRIAPENIIGMGPFVETSEALLIRDPISKEFCGLVLSTTFTRKRCIEPPT